MMLNEWDQQIYNYVGYDSSSRVAIPKRVLYSSIYNLTQLKNEYEKSYLELYIDVLNNANLANSISHDIVSASVLRNWKTYWEWDHTSHRSTYMSMYLP